MKTIVAAALALLMSGAASAAVVVGKVDVQKVLVTVKEGQKIRDQLKKTFDDKQKIIKDEEDKIRKAQEDFKKQGLVMNDSTKQKKEEEINSKIMALQQKSMEFQKELQEMENKFKRPILEKVKVIIEDVSKNAGVDVTFESATAPIIYAREEKDLTDDVIKAFDKKHNK